MYKTRIISVVAMACLGVSWATHAAPVQTFNGLEVIGDSDNTAANDVGKDFDIDGDAVLDLTLAWVGQSLNGSFGWDAQARQVPPVGSSALVITSSGNEAKLFTAGESIGPGGTTSDLAILASEDFFAGTVAGEFLPDFSPSATKRGFIGFSFDIGGNTHFGWADVEVDLNGDPGEGFLNLYGYGYETDPNTAIAAGGVIPLPAAAWLFASALGLLGWVRRRGV